MSNNKQSIMSNPFLQDAESTHEYNNQMFVVDYYPHPNGGTWQCCDANHYFRTRANTKDEAIQECHKKWDKHQRQMKTPMQEMLEWVRATLPMDLDWPRMIEQKVESMLEKEKEAMCQFADEFAIECINFHHEKTMSQEQFFNLTFNNKEK